MFGSFPKSSRGNILILTISLSNSHKSTLVPKIADMRQLLTVAAALLMLISSLVLTEQAKAQIEPANIDTLYHAQVAPGMYHTEYEIRSVPWRLQVLRIDQSEQQVEFRTVKANNRLTGLQRPMDMKAELENDSVYVVGGINGDFYGTGGVPVNAQIVDGALLKQPFSRELIAFDDNFQPFIETTSFSGSLEREGGNSLTVNGINQNRGENHLTVYNSFFGETTGTNAFGTEIGVRLVDTWIVNRPMRVVVEQIESNSGDMDIQSYDMVLSGHGTASEFLGQISTGDTLEVQLNLNPLDRPLLEAMGGSTQFIKNGVVSSNWEERHPRTAVGFSADTLNVYFVVVDGRQSRSAGMMLSELGDFMVEIGVDHAINLDGGGSSAMVIQDDVVNNPSDGGLQRAVANALFVTMKNPGIGEFERIQVRPGFQKLFLGRNLDLIVHAYDENHRRERLSNDDVIYTVDESLGQVSESGRFTAGFTPGTGYIYAEADGFRDSTRIEILGVDRILLSPKESSIDTTMVFSPSFSLRDFNGLPQQLSRNRLSWSVTDETVGAVNDEGNFLPQSPGRTGVIASIGEAADTAWVTVVQKDGFTELTDFSDTDLWDISTENLDSELVSIHSVDNGLEVQFSYPSQSEQSLIFLNRSIGIDGVPREAHIETSGDGEDYVLFVEIANPDDGRYWMAPQRRADHTEPEVLEYFFQQNWVTRISSGASFYFPFSLESFVLQLPQNSSGEDIEGVFRFHSAGVLYSEESVSVEDETQTGIPTEAKLHQNYPNPFNPVTVISYQIPSSSDVRLEVFDMLGRRVAVLVDDRVVSGHHEVNFDASNLASGMYIYQLRTDNYTLSNRMMLIK